MGFYNLFGNLLKNKKAMESQYIIYLIIAVLVLSLGVVIAYHVSKNGGLICYAKTLMGGYC